MHIAFLFDSDAPKYKHYYGPPIMRSLLKTDVMQASGRHIKVSVGDILIYSRAKSLDHYDELTNLVYFSDNWSSIILDRLCATFRRRTVYAPVFENMTEDIAMAMHSKLIKDKAYLGCMAVNYSYGPHLSLMRNSMVTKYRLIGRSCRILESMGESEDRDRYEVKLFKDCGYDDVGYEDIGAHKTIFDDYDSLAHFKQVDEFRIAVSPFLKGGEDSGYELTMVLEDLNPRLFNALGSAVRVLSNAKHEEDVAQASLSGRRFMESIADVLFPARDYKHNGRDVGTAKFRNRLWAYISDHSPDQATLQTLGKEVDALLEMFNKGLHGDVEAGTIMAALARLSELTIDIIALSPQEARQPYFAYKNNLEKFYGDIIEEAFEDAQSL